jgi:hypothetical protein
VIRPFVAFAATLAAALLALAPAVAQAQGAATKPPPPVTKAPPRLPPNASDTARIPAGVDTGSPGTSQSVPLVTPVAPVPCADRNELKTRSAAARAAARPKLAASSADCARPGAAALAGAAASSTAPAAAGKSTPPAARSTPSGSPSPADRVGPC